MTLTRRILLSLSLGAPSLLASVASAQSESAAINPAATPGAMKGIEGKEAPPLFADNWINLPENEDGKLAPGTPGIDLRKYRGNVVVLKFFQFWCPACQKRSFPKLKKLVEHYRGESRIQFIAVQTVFEGLTENTASKLEPTAEKFELDIPFGHSVKLRGIPNVNTMYRTGGTPWWVVVNKDGIIEFNGHFIDYDKAVENLDELIAASPATTSAAE